jgi:hypothetical protein
LHHRYRVARVVGRRRTGSERTRGGWRHAVRRHERIGKRCLPARRLTAARRNHNRQRGDQTSELICASSPVHPRDPFRWGGRLVAGLR